MERGFTLFAMTRAEAPARQSPAKQAPAKKAAGRVRRSATAKSQSGYRPLWDVGVGVNGKAMLKAADVLWIAGTPNEFPDDDIYRAVEGRAGGVLVAASASDGRTLSTHRLDGPPTWDGMAADGGRLFITLANGQVQCWAKR